MDYLLALVQVLFRNACSDFDRLFPSHALFRVYEPFARQSESLDTITTDLALSLHTARRPLLVSFGLNYCKKRGTIKRAGRSGVINRRASCALDKRELFATFRPLRLITLIASASDRLTGRARDN